MSSTQPKHKKMSQHMLRCVPFKGETHTEELEPRSVLATVAANVQPITAGPTRRELTLNESLLRLEKSYDLCEDIGYYWADSSTNGLDCLCGNEEGVDCIFCNLVCDRFSLPHPLEDNCPACKGRGLFEDLERSKRRAFRDEDLLNDKSFNRNLSYEFTRADFDSRIREQDLLLKFEMLVPEFNSASWFPGRFQEFMKSDFIDGFKRGVNSDNCESGILMLDALFYELAFRNFSGNFLAQMFEFYSKSRTLLFEKKKPSARGPRIRPNRTFWWKAKPSSQCLVKPALRRSAAVFDRAEAEEAQKYFDRLRAIPTWIEIEEAKKHADRLRALPTLAKPLLVDWIEPKSYLRIGVHVCHCVADLAPFEFSLFSRNKPKFREMMSCKGPLDQFQAWIDQKLLSDSNFKNRVDRSFLPTQAILDRTIDLVIEGKLNHGPFLQGDGDLEFLGDDESSFRGSTIELTDLFTVEHFQQNAFSIIEGLTALGVTIDLLCKQTSWLARFEVMYLYVRSLDKIELVNACFSEFEWRRQRFLNGPSPELDYGVFHSFQSGGPVEGLLEEMVSFVGISNVMAMFLGMPMSATQFFHKRLTDFARRADGDEPLKRFWKAFVSFLRCLKDCCVERSLSPMFTPGSSPGEVLAEAEALDMYRNQVVGLTSNSVNKDFLRLYEAGKLPASWSRPFTQEEYLSKVGYIRGKLDECIPLVAIALQTNYKSARARLNLIIEGSAGSFACNSMRVQPLGIILTGPPGTGKSLLTAKIIEYIGRSMGFPVDANGRYDLQSDVNFQDNADPFKWAFVGDDLDHAMKPPAAGQKSHVDWIMDVVNNKPFPIESARAEEKGKNFGRPLMLLYCTNHHDLKLTNFSSQFDAVYRRLSVKLIPRVKNEFARGSMVDKIKAKGVFNIHDIEVQEYDGSSYKVIGTWNDEQVLRYCLEKFKQNLVDQRALMEQSDLGVCASCPMPVSKGQRFCGEHFVEEADEPSLQGQGISIAKMSDTLDDFNKIGSEIRNKDVVGRVSDVLSSVESMAKSTSAKFSRPGKIVGSIVDFIQNHGDKLAACLGVVIAGVVAFRMHSTFQEREDNASDKIVPDWQKLSAVVPSSESSFAQTTWSEDQLVEQTRKHIGRFFCGSRFTHCVRIGANFVLAPHHITVKVSEGEDFRVLIDDVACSVVSIVQFGTQDLVLVKIAGSKKALSSCFPYFANEVDVNTSVYDDVYIITPNGKMTMTGGRYQSRSNAKVADYVGPSFHYEILTQDGDCGLPVVARKGPYVRIIALHHVQYKKLTLSGTLTVGAGCMISKSAIKYKSSEVGHHFQDGVIIPFCEPESTLVDLKPVGKSELAYSLLKGAKPFVLGRDPSFRGQSAGKSKCHRSLIYEEIEPLARKMLGKPHYWQAPLMKGIVTEDGSYLSGYQYIFDYYRETESHDLLRRPVLDYVQSLEECDFHGYRHISYAEAISGVPGSVIGKVNRATSVGPPGSGPKSKVISQGGESHPDVHAQIEQIENLLRADVVPIPIATCTLKDEPVKYSKNASANIRVFNCLPMAFNLACKVYLSPIKAFFRNNSGACESMVGIDMTSDGGDFIAQRFSMINPSLDNVIEGDFTKMDKTINSDMAWAVVEVFGRLARLLGLDEEKVRLLVIANFRVVYSIKGELFFVGGMNPSGSDITVEINGVVNSLVHRYLWVRRKGLCPVSANDFDGNVKLSEVFQDENVLVTYGDDFLQAHAIRVDTEDLFSGTKDVGMIITDAYDKTLAPKYRSLFEVSFLKRSFRRHEASGSIRCGLQMPSILRMILILKPSVLSSSDHMAVVCEEALREIYLGGRTDFCEWRELFRRLSIEKGFASSRYLSLLSEEEYEEKIQSKTFKTWGLDFQIEDEVLDVDPSCFVGIHVKEINLQSSKMSNLPTTSALSDDSTADQRMSATTNLPALASKEVMPGPNTYGSTTAGGEGDTEMTHATGNIVSLTNPVKAGSTGITRVDQLMADSSFSESLFRNVKVLEADDFALAGNQVSFRPWISWGNNDFVDEKLQNFNYIRGSMVISGVLKAPALSSGLIVVTAVPYYESISFLELEPMFSLVPLHAVLDLSTSSDFELTLPWIVASDWGNLHDGDYESYWRVYVTTLVPLASAIPEGCVAANLTIFARPGPDFELAGATFQMNRSTPVSSRQGTVGRSVGRAVGRNPSTRAGGAKGKVSIDSVNETVKSYTGGHKASEVAATVAWGAAGITATVPVLAPYAAPVAASAGLMSGILSYFGFTRETKLTQPVETMVKPGPNFVNADGPDGSHVGALFSTNGLSIDPAISGALSAVDESSFAFINSRYTQVADLEFTVGSPTIIDYMLPVTPYMGSYSGDMSYFHPTTSGFLGSRFKFWRGDIEYLIYPVLSPIHRGALQVIWQPIPTDAAIAEDLTNLSTNTILDLAAAQPYSITVGYNNDNPMCFSDFYTQDTPISSVDYSTINGYLRIRSIVPITGSMCGTTVHVLVFQRSGGNMQFSAPTDLVSIEGELFYAGDDVIMTPTLQSGVEEIESFTFQAGVVGADGQEIVEISLIPSSGNYPMKEILSGEEVVSIRALLQKPCLMKFDENGDGDIVLPGPQMLWEHWHDPTSRGGDYIAWYGTAFLGMAGSVRYKMMIDKDSYVPYGTPEPRFETPMRLVPLIGYSSDSTVNTCPVSEICPIVTDHTLTAEMTVPYYFNEKYISAYRSFSARGPDMFSWTTRAKGNFCALLYKSAGPDVRLTFFRCQNSLTFVDSVTDDELDPWTRIFLNEGPALAVSEETAPAMKLAAGSDRRKFSLNQYMARTGRSVEKIPEKPVSRRPRKSQRVSIPARATQKDVVVAFVPPLKPASRRRVV